MDYDLMTDEEYKELDEAEVKPCPFCGAEIDLEDDHHGAYYVHPDNNCLLDRYSLLDVERVKLWNKRVVDEE